MILRPPASEEDQRGRRWPYVTFALIALNILLLVVTNGAIERQDPEYARRAQEAIGYYQAHPYLTPGPPLDRWLAKMSRPAGLSSEPSAGRAGSQESGAGKDPIIKAAEQDELDALCRYVSLADEARTLKRFGYIPIENNWPGLITYQFLNSRWLYLLGNMFLLWLAGSNMEERWGHALYPAFYLGAGVAAALAHKLAGPQSLVPLFGASGAVAGVMGAFLVKFLLARIKLPLIGFFCPQFPAIPAYLLFPPWLVVQLLCGVASVGAGLESGVAFGALAGGFAYGALFAVVLGLSGLDAHLDQA